VCSFANCTAKELQQPVIKDGHRVCEKRTLNELRDFVRQQLSTEIWIEEQRFENPHRHYVDMSCGYYALKMALLHEIQAGPKKPEA
jgi:nicotinate phosphoribosyltransferase